MDEQNYYDMSQDPTTGLNPVGMPAYQSPAAADLADGTRDAKIDGIYSNVMAIKGKTDGISGAYSMPAYGNEQAGMTNMRVAYGGMPTAMAYGAAAGAHTVVGGAYDGASRMMADLGSMIRPMTYTPPARVYTGYSGRVMQQTGFFSSAKTMLGFGDIPRSSSPYLYQLNAAEDFGERTGLGLGGLGVSAATIAAGALGGSLGGRAAGFAGSVLGGLVAYQAAATVGEGIYEGIAARQDVQNYLGRASSQFVTTGSSAVDPRRGAGFSREARREVAEYLRAIDIKDPMLGTGDLATILKGATDLGMFAGTREVTDFKKKFKSIVDNLKTVTVTLNQTLEEGLQTMKDLKGVGIDAGQAGDVVLRAQSLGRMSGRTAGEMVNIGLQGAELFRGTGVQMNIGFQSNLMNLASIRASRDAGLISQEGIAQAGGEEALAQRMTGGTLSFIQSDIGRAAGAAYFQQGMGFNPAAFADMTNRRVDISDMAQAAARNLSSPGAIIDYTVNQAKNLADLGKAAGGRGFDVAMMGTFIAQAETVSRLTGINREDATRHIMLNAGIDQSTIDARMAELKNPQARFEEAQKALQSSVAQQIGDVAVNNFVFNRLSEKAGDYLKGWYDVAARPINQMAGDIADWAEDVRDSAYGISRWSVAGVGVGAYDVSTAGLAGRTDRRIEFSRAAGRRVDLSESTSGWFLKGTTGASEILDLAKSEAGAQALRQAGLSLATVPESEAGNLGLVLEKGFDFSGKKATGFSGDYMQGLTALARSVTVTQEQAKKMDTDNRLSTLKNDIKSKLMGGADITRAKTFTDYGRVFFGDGPMTSEQQAALIQTLGPSGANVSAFSEVYTSSLRAAQSGRSTLEQLEAEQISTLTTELKNTYDSLGTSVGVKDPEALGFLSQAMEETSPIRKDALVKSGIEAALKAGEGDIYTSGRAKRIAEMVASPSDALKGAARGVRTAQEKLAFLREEKGARVAADAVRMELADNTKLSQADKAEALRVAELVTSPAGFTLVAGGKTEDFVRNQTALKTTTVGNELASSLEKYRGATLLSTMKDKDEDYQRTALKRQGIAEANLQGVLDFYKTRGVDKAQEDAIGEANRTLGGTSGVAAVGGVGAPGGNTAADNMAILTNTNWATYKAMAALADRLGAGR